MDDQIDISKEKSSMMDSFNTILWGFLKRQSMWSLVCAFS